jgi:hypothetical protein
MNNNNIQHIENGFATALSEAGDGNLVLKIIFYICTNLYKKQ